MSHHVERTEFDAVASDGRTFRLVAVQPYEKIGTARVDGLLRYRAADGSAVNRNADGTFTMLDPHGDILLRRK
jgi:hypothetical protein